MGKAAARQRRAEMRNRRGTLRALPAAHTVQAAVEGAAVIPDGKIELKGKLFRHAETIGMMPLLVFAKASQRGVRSEDMEGLAAIHDMIQDAIDAEDWAEFKQHAIDTKSEAEDLLGVVKQVIEHLAHARTGSRSGSSSGSSKTSPSSKESSSPTGSSVPVPEGGYIDVADLMTGP